MAAPDTLQILRAHLGPDPIAVLARRLRREPEQIIDLVGRDLAGLLDLAEDPDLVEAILACMLADADRR